MLNCFTLILSALRTLRLSFVTSTVEQIATGIAALAAAIRESKG